MCSNSIIIEKIEKFVKIKEEIKRNIKLLHVFKDIWDTINVILVTNEDKVYCFGPNTFGVLGFGHRNNVQEFTINEDLSNKRIIDFKSSDCHTIARDNNGKLYCWGENKFLGNGREDEEISKPELNKYLLNENIIDMCCGFGHTLVLTSNNEVYGWGYNDCGQIGNTSSGEDEWVSIPFKLNEFNGEKVKAISCGYKHSMALTESGSVYSWGYNRFGQLGINSDNKSENKPKLIQIEVKIEKISCGLNHSLLLSSEGHIYVFGSNKDNQLGLETNRLAQLTPIKLNHSEKFIEIASHYNYEISAALSENGLYYVWGDCGEEDIISVPKETQFKSFDEIFAITESSNLLFENGKYAKNWTEIRKLGEGSYGTVFEVENKLNENKTFAIKKIPLVEGNCLKEDSLKEYFNFDNISKQNNEFLVKYYSSWLERDLKLINGIRKYCNNSTLYIKMDLCDKTLSTFYEEIKDDSKLFSNNSLTLLGYYLLSEIFIEILKGVKYLHNINIIHRDLHPDNILVKSETNGNCIKIGDFGLAKLHDNNQLHTKDRGHVKYQATEVANSRKYDTKADIYSLGVILQELFDIDVNSDYINNGNETSLLMCKLKNASVLSIKMKNEVYRERPNCQQILEERNNWVINENEFNFKEELNILLEISQENRSYVQNIIVSKLSNTSTIKKSRKASKPTKKSIKDTKTKSKSKSRKAKITSKPKARKDSTKNTMKLKKDSTKKIIQRIRKNRVV